MSKYTIETTDKGFRVRSDEDSYFTEKEEIANEVLAISLVIGFGLFLLWL
jgi:hypothetical protein